MNFGHGITIALVAFVVFIMTLIISFMRQDVDLEYTDYYARELVFNEAKEAKERGLAYADFLALHVENEQVVVEMKENFPAIPSAELHFYRADNADYDRTYTVSSNRLNLFPLKDFQKGKYELRMTWKLNDEDYYVAKNLYVAK